MKNLKLLLSLLYGCFAAGGWMMYFCCYVDAAAMSVFGYVLMVFLVLISPGIALYYFLKHIND